MREINTVFIQGLTVFLLVMLGPGCSEPQRQPFQGYVEGEFIHVSSPLAGKLQTLAVRRGMDVPEGSPLFTLEHGF
jgi:HlyD family secretion protein